MHGVGPVGRSVCVGSVVVDQPLFTGALENAVLRHIGVEDTVVDPEQPRDRSSRIANKIPLERAIRLTYRRKCTEWVGNGRCILWEPCLSVYNVKAQNDVADVDVCQKSRRRRIWSSADVVDTHDPGICEIQLIARV